MFDPSKSSDFQPVESYPSTSGSKSHAAQPKPSPAFGDKGLPKGPPKKRVAPVGTSLFGAKITSDKSELDTAETLVNLRSMAVDDEDLRVPMKTEVTTDAPLAAADNAERKAARFLALTSLGAEKDRQVTVSVDSLGRFTLTTVWRLTKKTEVVRFKRIKLKLQAPETKQLYAAKHSPFEWHSEGTLCDGSHIACKGVPQLHYTSAERDGVVYHVNGCAYLRAGNDVDEPYIARIVDMWEVKAKGNDGEKWMKCQWFYRPHETILHKWQKRRKMEDRELVLSNACDNNPLNSVIGPCSVPHAEMVTNWEEFRRTPDTFFFKEVYNPVSMEFTAITKAQMVDHIPLNDSSVFKKKKKKPWLPKRSHNTQRMPPSLTKKPKRQAPSKRKRKHADEDEDEASEDGEPEEYIVEDEDDAEELEEAELEGESEEVINDDSDDEVTEVPEPIKIPPRSASPEEIHLDESDGSDADHAASKPEPHSPAPRARNPAPPTKESTPSLSPAVPRARQKRPDPSPKPLQPCSPQARKPGARQSSRAAAKEDSVQDKDADTASGHMPKATNSIRDKTRSTGTSAKDSASAQKPARASSAHAKSKAKKATRKGENDSSDAEELEPLYAFTWGGASAKQEDGLVHYSSALRNGVEFRINSCVYLRVVEHSCACQCCTVA